MQSTSFRITTSIFVSFALLLLILLIPPSQPSLAGSESLSIIALAGGSYHTCALTSGGGVKCWGNNGSGRLGDGTMTGDPSPVDVIGLTSGVSAIAAGDEHTCALMTGGGVKCWGENEDGRLGNGSNSDRSTPVDVSNLTSGVAAITTGGNHTCALTITGGVKCWGDNSFGQLGDGAIFDRSIPTDVSGLTSGVIAIAAGDQHTCAVTTGGGVKCWGLNNHGQLGNNSTTDSNVPVDVSDLTSGAVSIAAGQNHACAVTIPGGAKCWGENAHGQLGDASTTERLAPVAVSQLSSGVAALTAGWGHTCARTSSGGAKCWGSNGYGRLGDGTEEDRLAPTDVSGLASGASVLVAGGYHTCAALDAAHGAGVKCWGFNYYGELGTGDTEPSTTPKDVVGLDGGDATPGPTATNTPSATGTPPAPTPTVTPPDDLWKRVDAPVEAQFRAVDIASATDSWIVGFNHYSPNQLPVGSVILRWNGKQWASVPSPTTKPLYTVDMTSPTQGWAGGGTGDEGGIILEWDGNQWSQANHPAIDGNILGISMRTPDDGWAVGGKTVTTSSCFLGTILHWDGESWSHAASGLPSIMLRAVAPVAADDVWVAGTYCQGADPINREYRSVVGHWNGKVWGFHTNAVNGWSISSISVIDAGNVWMAGDFGLIAHWQGGQWTRGDTPTQAHLTGIAMTSPSDGWAVGNSGGNATVLHWDGETWESVQTPAQNALQAVTLASYEGWVVGQNGEILHYHNIQETFIPFLSR